MCNISAIQIKNAILTLDMTSDKSVFQICKINLSIIVYLSCLQSDQNNNNLYYMQKNSWTSLCLYKICEITKLWHTYKACMGHNKKIYCTCYLSKTAPPKVKSVIETTQNWGKNSASFCEINIVHLLNVSQRVKLLEYDIVSVYSDKSQTEHFFLNCIS